MCYKKEVDYYTNFSYRLKMKEPGACWTTVRTVSQEEEAVDWLYNSVMKDDGKDYCVVCISQMVLCKG